VRAVKAKKNQDEADALRAAVAETLKYSTKPADMTSDSAWFLELTRQTHKIAIFSVGRDAERRFEAGRRDQRRSDSCRRCTRRRR
ncbi:protein rep, partial [Salinivibrio socompensis]|uniref:protein rep n=1 Tax=Salinivibrio socompensis TaxID=1510206 RepID=UPI0013E2FE25